MILEFRRPKQSPPRNWPQRRRRKWTRTPKPGRRSIANIAEPLLVAAAVVTVAALVFTFPQWSFLLDMMGGGTSVADGANGRSGIASVIDGDTLELHGQRIRLVGIDAPESRQVCHVDGQQWRCGQSAANALADHIEGKTLDCRGDDRDRYGRTLAICWLGLEDVNGWLVSEGWALAYRRYSTAYVSLEDAARIGGRGIWASEFVAPWDWRKQH